MGIRSVFSGLLAHRTLPVCCLCDIPLFADRRYPGRTIADAGQASNPSLALIDYCPLPLVQASCIAEFCSIGAVEGLTLSGQAESRLGRRIIVIGASNAGKSTLGQQLAGHLGVPFIELDALYWEPNWVEAERELFRERVRRAIESDGWVLAGNYRLQQDISWPAADTIIWLDLPLRTVLRRCVVRSWQRWRSRELLWGTNHENFWAHLMLWSPSKSLITYTILRHRARRREVEADMRDPRWARLTFIHLRSVEALNCWLAGFLTRR